MSTPHSTASSSSTQPSRSILLKRLFGAGNVLVIHRRTLDMLNGDHLAAIFLEQLLYWSERTSHPEGWIVKTYEEWENELYLSAYQVKAIVKRLKPFGLEAEVHRSTFHQNQPVVHYRLRENVLLPRLFAEPDDDSFSFSESEVSSVSETRETSVSSYTEPTTERRAEQTTTLQTPKLQPPKASEAAVGEALGMTDLPDHLSPADVRAVKKQARTNDTFRRMEASNLSVAWAEAVAAKEPYSYAQRLWENTRYREAFLELADQGCTPDELKALYTEKRKPGADYLLRFAVEDYPAWAQARQQQTAAQGRAGYQAPPEPEPLSEAEKAEMKAMREAMRRKA